MESVITEVLEVPDKVPHSPNEIHILLKVFSPSDLICRFWISAQLFASSPIRACIQTIFVSFSKALAVSRGRGGG